MREKGMCKKLEVPKDVCCVSFGVDKNTPRQIHHTEEKYTTRDELMLVHYNKKDRVVEIELISDNKPCQMACHSINIDKLIEQRKKKKRR